jgi:hypothetical protein
MDNTQKKSTDYGLTWSSLLVPSNIDNRRGIVANNNVIYLGTNQKGLLRFNESWSAPLTNTSSLSIGAKNMVISESGTIQRFFSSTRGQSFIINTPHTSDEVRIFSGSNIPVNSICSCGTDNLSTVYVGSSTGHVHKVTISWGDTNNTTSLSCSTGIKINTSDSNSVKGMACSSNGIIVYACTGIGRIYKSTNSGVSFSQLGNSPSNPGPSTTTSQWQDLACSSDGNVVVACVYSKNIHISDNGGESWSNVVNSSGTPTTSNWGSIDISRDGTKLMAAQNGIMTANFT